MDQYRSPYHLPQPEELFPRKPCSLEALRHCQHNPFHQNYLQSLKREFWRLSLEEGPDSETRHGIQRALEILELEESIAMNEGKTDEQPA